MIIENKTKIKCIFEIIISSPENLIPVTRGFLSVEDFILV